MYAQAAIKPDPLLRDDTYGIIMRDVQKCTLGCSSLRGRKRLPLCCIKLDTATDSTCGTAGFLISAMHKMLSMVDNEQQGKNIKKKQLHGSELQSNMFAVMAANMVLRRDGNSNLEYSDFLAKNPTQVQMRGATVGLMNPPYSQSTEIDPGQRGLSFIGHSLGSLTVGVRAAVIVP